MGAVHLLALMGLVGVQVALPVASYAAAASHGCCRSMPCDRETPSARPDCCMARPAPAQAEPATHNSIGTEPLAALPAPAWNDAAALTALPSAHREAEGPDSQAPPLYLQHASLLR